MKKNLFLTIMCLCLALIAKAEVTDISDIENVVYAENMSCSANSSFTMSVKMKNKQEITGFQFDLVLPSGITVETDADGFYLIDLSLERTTAAKTNYFDSAEQPDGSVRVMASSTKNYTFSGNDGEVATIKIKVADDIAEGTYPVILKNIVLSDPASQSYETEKIEVELTVGSESKSYDEGYSVEFAPIELDANGGGEATTDIYFNVKSDVVQAKTVSFDVVFPKEWYDNYMISDVVKNSSLNTRFYTLSDPIDNGDGSYRFTLTAKSAAYYFGKVASTKIGSFTLYQDAGGDDGEYSIEEGIYAINTNNVSVTGSDNETYSPAPTTSYVKVGTPTNQTISLSGHVSASVNESLATESAVTSVDMSNVTSIDGTLNLIDGRSFIAPKKNVSVEAVTYTRSLPSTWGTICMPFALTSDENTQYYKLSSVSGDNMTFEPVANVEAGEPAVFKKSNGGVLDINESNTTITAGSKEKIQNAGGWTMKGTYTTFNNNPAECDNNIYYIAENKFWYANQTFPVSAFRGWFEVAKSNAAKIQRYSILEGEYNATAIKYVENPNGTVNIVFDLSGKKVSSPQKGINIINGKTVIVK